MNKQQQEDLNRTNELKVKIWSQVIKNKYMNKPNPDEISIDDIESNQGRVQKAMRLLGREVKYVGEANRNRYNGDSHTIQMYKVMNLDDSSSFASKPEFMDVLHGTHNRLFPITYQNQTDMDTICYNNLYDLRPECIIYVYWNEKEFDFVRTEYEMRIYPIALLDVRMKHIMRSLVEHYFHTFFHNRMEEYLGLKEGSIKKEDHFDPKIRNFAAHGHRFNMKKYYGKNGFLEEYTHFRDYFQALIDQMKMFQYYVDNAGGQDAVIERYRKDIITTLPKKAPLYAFTTQVKEDSVYSRLTPIEDQFKNQYLNAFILKNAQYLNYNLLYSEDKEILYIDLNDRCIRVNDDTTFTPDQGELDLIAGKA